MEYQSDFLLVNQARNGEEDACAALVKKYYPSIYQFCRLHIYDSYEAEDLTQEVFISFFGSLHRYREYGKVKNYLYTIAGNLVKNYYKKRKDIPIDRLPENQDACKSDIEEIEKQREIEDAVKNLPDDIREVAILFFFQELKQREIADILHIKLSLVKYRIRCARDLLEEELEVKT